LHILSKSTRRWLLWGAVIAAVVAWSGGYVGSYVVLSRRGMEEARQVGFPAFFYVPMRESGPSSPGLSRHYRLRSLYDPINQIDRLWFGGGTPCGGLTWGLSGTRQGA
jgi:hypothetical protein